MKKIFFYAAGILLFTTVQAQSIKTQNQQIALTTKLNEIGNFIYSVDFKKNPVVKPSHLGMNLSKPSVVLTQFTLISIDSSEVKNTWKPIWGEQDEIENNYKQIVYHLKSKITPSILVNIEFRVFKDGVGFRYQFPSQSNLNYFIIKDELSEIQLNGDHKAFWIPGDFDSNEYMYNTTRLSEINAVEAAAKEKDIAVTSLINEVSVQTPLMLKSENGLYINIHEAALLNYPAMNLTLNKTNFSFSSTLVPDAVGNKAYLNTPSTTPWRTILVSDKAADMLSSKTILNLNEPSKVANTDWIRPQKFVGVWWEMHIGKATWQKEGGKHGANTQNVKKYIDFAAAHHFDGVLVEGWNQGWEDWFGNWKEEVFDFVTPYDDYAINQLSAYAKEKGVKIIMHHETSGSH